MTTLTIRIPDEKATRLREMARQRGISLNKLMEEFSTLGLAEFDSETRFRLRAARGSAEQGMALLDKLDKDFASQSKGKSESEELIWDSLQWSTARLPRFAVASRALSGHSRGPLFPPWKNP